MKDFYVKYFSGKANNMYNNPEKNFSSYFISFENGTKIELMHKPDVNITKDNNIEKYIGFAHIAFSVGSKENVDKITSLLQKDGYELVSPTRTTGDGYYESCLLDPEGNKVEITI